ncbi:MAG TPA: ABC transporter permease [Methanobacteriaceae archaeon]|nr:ABC transporter permease [Methanobacteriaceae archaeon]
MKNDNFGNMIAKVLKNGFKSKRTLGMAIIVPLVILIVLGYIVTMIGTVDPVKIGVVNNDKGIGNISAASSIIEELKGQENVTIVSINANEIKSDLDDKTITVALIFPENFTIDLAKKNAQINLILEGTDQSANILVNKLVTASITKVAARSANITSPLKINVTSLYGEGLDFTDLFMYRFMTLVILMLSAAIAMVTILGDKQTNRFKRMSASPVKAVLAYTMGLSVFGFISVPIVLAFAIYIMGLTIVGDISSTALLLLLIAVVGTSLGVMVTAITKTKNQAFGLFGLIVILQVIFGGLLIPITRFDYYTQFLSHILPFTYGLDAMKNVVIRGFTLGDVGTDLIALFAVFISALIISMVGFKVVQKSESLKGGE